MGTLDRVPTAGAGGKGRGRGSGAQDWTERARWDIRRLIGRVMSGRRVKAADTSVVGDGLPWYEKYRPRTLEHVVAHKEVTGRMEGFIEKNRLPNLLFHGPAGTGKTSTIIAVARRMYGARYRARILEVDASDERGIERVCEQIKRFAKRQPLLNIHRGLIILDKVDSTSAISQTALCGVIDRCTNKVSFCIVCRDVDWVVPMLKSRCSAFRFSPVPKEDMEKMVDSIVQRESINLTTEGKASLIELCRGDMRRALELLHACHTAYDIITAQEVYDAASVAGNSVC